MIQVMEQPLYLDAREKKYIDECGPANFLQ